MELQELYQVIDLQPEMVESLQKIGPQVDLGELEPCLEQLTDRRTAKQAYQDLVSRLGEDEGSMKMLYCQLECARRVFATYQEKRIAKSVYVDTMKCFTRFIKECMEKNGRMFFDRGWWTYRQLSMELFRIGALEYQFQEYEGERVIALHIPSDADMTSVSIDNSLEQAQRFFRTYYDGYVYDKYVCDSWLLSPVLQTLLSETSHITAFRNRFTIMQADTEGKEFMEWLFKVPEDSDIDKLPETTSLQRKAKKLLLEGGNIGAAFGVFQK